MATHFSPVITGAPPHVTLNRLAFDRCRSTRSRRRVENHKWVIQEEIKDANDKTLEPGTEVTVEGDHMKGMEGVSS